MRNRKARRATLITAALAAAFHLLAGCGGEKERSARPAEAATLDQLAGTEWVLRWWDREEPALLQTEVTLNYADGTFSGSNGCNNYFNAVEAGAAPGEIAVGLGGATQKACPEPDSTTERRFMGLLQAARRIAMTGGELEIHYEFEGREGVLMFKAREPRETE